MNKLDRVIATPQHVLASVTFLSRLPTWRLMRAGTPDFAKSAAAFPLAGWLIAAIPLALAYATSLLTTNPWAVAVMVVGAMMLTTGALHEDGLADVADGFWGGHTRERKLEIMRDSSIGTYGTLALVIVTAMRTACLAPLLAAGPAGLLLAYAAVCSLSRAAILVPWTVLRPARPAEGSTGVGKDEAGLSARYGGPDTTSLWLAAFWSLPALFIIVYATPVALLPGLAALGIIVWLAHHHIGGHTGDVLGATQQLVEAGLLFGLTLAISAP